MVDIYTQITKPDCLPFDALWLSCLKTETVKHLKAWKQPLIVTHIEAIRHYEYDYIYEVDPSNGQVIDTITVISDTDTIFVECDSGLIRGSNVCGKDPLADWFSFGPCDDSEEVFYDKGQAECDVFNIGTWSSVYSFCYYDINANGNWDQHTGIINEFIDYDVIDGIDYTYSITAYDMGIAADYTLNYDENLGILDTTYSSSNPLHFATPDGYSYIESGRGDNSNDKQVITLKSGPMGSEVLREQIRVVPNPYIVSSHYNETEYSRKLRFTNLPQNCRITIYTVSGERVVSFNNPGNNLHAECGDVSNGSCYWDMRTHNNQEIAPGLYLFTVEDTSNDKGNKFIGKFAVVK